MREFRNVARTGKTRIWRVDAVGNQLITEYGELEGAMQRVTDTALPVNVGKSNAKTAEEVAVDMMNRQILLKTRNGYTELGVEQVAATSIDFDALPVNLRFYKPDNSMSAGMEKKLEEGKALLFRKRDGEAFIVCIGTTGAITLYSRTMMVEHDKEPGTLWANRFPQIMADLEDAQLPPCTILLGELIMDRDGQDDYKHVTRCVKALCARSLATQETEGWLSYYVWDVAFWAGESFVSTRPMVERLARIEQICAGKEFLIPMHCQSTYGFPPETKGATVKEMAIAFAASRGWEGFVVVDTHTPGYGDKAYNFRGKTDRPGKFCSKLKPSKTDDFCVFWNPDNGIGEYGSGKYQGLIGSVQLFQYDSKGKLHFISECGNGFSEKDLRELSVVTLGTVVFEVKYDERTYISDGDKTNCLRFPRFIRVREDKTPAECVNPALDAE